MEEVFIGIVALVLQIFLQIIWAARRPWKYLFSAEYREQVKLEWAGRSKVFFHTYIFGGLVLLVASIAVISYLVYFVFLAPEPEPTAIESIKTQAKDLFIEAAKEAYEQGNL